MHGRQFSRTWLCTLAWPFLLCHSTVYAAQPEFTYLETQHKTCEVMTIFEGLQSGNPAAATFYHVAFNDNNERTTVARKTAGEIEGFFDPSQRVIYACCDGCDTVLIEHTPASTKTSVNINVESVAKFLWKQDSSQLQDKERVPPKTIATCQKKLEGHRADCDCTGPGVQANYETYVSDTGGCPVGTYWGGCNPASSMGRCIACTSALDETSVYTSSGDLGRDNCEFQCKSDHYYAQNDPTTESNLCRPCTTCAAGYYTTTPCSQVVDILSESDLDTQCIPCPPGQSSAGNNAASCANCGYGFKSTDFGSPCVPCSPWQYTPTDTATQCLACRAGFVANPAKSDCTPCPRGSYRGANMRECALCPIGTAQNDTGQISCQTCVGAVALTAGSTECGSCPPGTLPNPIRINTDGSLQQGGIQCLNCSRLGVPSDETTIDWLENCQWQCREGYYRDFYAIECIPCNVPCTTGGVTGLYRPFCTAGTLGLPPCVACNNSPIATSVPGVALRYTGNAIATTAASTPSCTFECLPGFHTANCVACPAAPDDATFTAACAWQCARGMRAVGNTCVACSLEPHPRTLKEAVSFPSYFGTDAFWVDFDICNDNEQKAYGHRMAYVEGVSPPRCGNGVLELQTEECDDANVADGDGCSSTCTLEHNYHDCSNVGQPCAPNCSFPWTTTTNLPSLRGYYVSDPSCTRGPRDLSTRRTCALLCPDRALNVDDCTPENQGCLTCDSGSYMERTTVQCLACGSICETGYYSIPTCVDGQPEDTQLARGCDQCSTPNVDAITWTSAGTVVGDFHSCRFTCNANYFCDGTVNPVDNSCTGTCSPCTAPSTLTCGAGTFPTPCTLTHDTQCGPCASKPKRSQWDATATGYCKFQCDADTKWVPELQLCDPCTFPKTCPAGYRTRLCDDSVADNVDALDDPRYCEKCNPVTDRGMEAVASASGRCEKDCILGKFFAPDPSNATCMQCAIASTCHAGTRYVPCTRREDTQCTPCRANDPATSFLEYYTPTGEVPDCQMRCIQNYAWDNEYKTCRPCAQRCTTQPGMHAEHQCLGIGERAALPECIPCNDQRTRRPENAHYTTKCEWQCDTLYYKTKERGVPACKQCQACPIGAYPTPPFVCTSASPRLQCTVCTNIPEHGDAISNTDATCPFTCHLGYYKQWINNGATQTCTPRWSVQQFLAKAVASTPTPPPQTTPPPARAVIVVENRPIRFQSSEASMDTVYNSLTMLIAISHIFLVIYEACRY